MFSKDNQHDGDDEGKMVFSFHCIRFFSTKTVIAMVLFSILCVVFFPTDKGQHDTQHYDNANG